MNDDKLRELGRELPFDRPDVDRRESVRASLLLAADATPPRRSRRGLAFATAGFAAGVLAAAAIALLLVRPARPTPPGPRAQITASPTAELEHSITPTPTGSDEVVRVHTGTVRIAAPPSASTDHIRLETRDAAIETVGAGDYEAVVAHDRLASVTVHTGTARVAIAGHEHPVFLAAGETWQAKVITADVGPGSPPTTAESAHAATAVTPESTRESTPAATAATPESTRAATAATPDSTRGETAATPESTRGGTAATPPSTPESTRGGIAAIPKSTLESNPGATHDGTASTPTSTPESTRGGIASSAATGESTRAGSAATPAPASAGFANTDRPPAAASVRTASATERHFQAGWALLRAGKAREAAVELGAAADAGDRDPLAVDARYFQAVALMKAGATHEAERALVAFLDRAPTSLRRGRASVMLARLIAERGDAKSARAWFESALRDPDPDVAAAAKAGLDGLRP